VKESEVISINSQPRLLSGMSVAAALLIAATSGIAMADLPANTAWYSGDPNLTNWGNQVAAGNPQALQHWQPFEVTAAAGWTIDTVFSVGSAFGSRSEWSIRTGMGASGMAGTTVAGGLAGAPIVTSHLGFDVVQVDIPDLFLPQGIYWLMVAADNGSITGTNGINSIGSTPALHSIRNWPLFGQNYQPFSDARLSSGVTIPTPAGASLLALGGLAISRRRRTR